VDASKVMEKIMCFLVHLVFTSLVLILLLKVSLYEDGDSALSVSIFITYQRKKNVLHS
jgi:hypothetical protein